MRRQFVALLFSMLSVTGFGASPDEQAQFIATFRKAFQVKDAQILAGLNCWDGVDPQMKQTTITQMQRTMDSIGDIIGIQIVAPAANEPAEAALGGKKYRVNLPTENDLKVDFAAKGQLKDTTLTLRLGEKDGKLLIVNFVVENGGK